MTAAADWFAKLQERETSEKDFLEWQRWLNAAPEHQRAYRDIEHAWRLIGEVKPTPWASRQELAAEPPLQFAHPLRGESAEARNSTRWLQALAASVLVFLTVGGLAYWLDSPVESFSTGTAEQRSVRLPDGSRVTLGAASKVTQVYEAGARRVVLNFGEAFFEVAHDAERPFTVVVGQTEVRAVGTAFNVRVTSDRILVSVTEGRVAVDPSQTVARPEVMLSAGQQAGIARDGAVLERVSTLSAVTWLQGPFEYRGEELRYVIEDLNRYTDRRIVLTDESLGALRYSGTVFPDHLDEWLEGISGVLPVMVRDGGSQREIAPAP